MHDVVQLRIHGVGGNPADGLLGLPQGAATIRVAGDDDAGFYARPDDPHVQGYVWWRLTGSALVQVLWIFLLPFTLFNVANWMFPGSKDESDTRQVVRMATRFLMFLLGLSLTLSYLLWEVAIIVQLLFYQWRLGGWLDKQPPGWLQWLLPSWLEHSSTLRAAGLGMVGVMLAGVAIYFVARGSRREFEQFTGPEHRLDSPPEPKTPLLGLPISSTEALDDPSFWWRPKASTRLLRIHAAAAVFMFAGLVAWTIPRARTGSPLNLRPWFLSLTVAQVVLILLVLVLYFVGWPSGTHFKVASPIMMALLSVALTTGFFSGITFWLAHRLHLPSVGLDLDQSPVYGIHAVVFVGSLLVWLGKYWLGRRQERAKIDARKDIPLNNAPPGAEPTGASPKMLDRVALLRSFSRCLERIDLLLTPASVAFVAAAVAILFFGVSAPNWLVTFGRWELVTLVGIALPALVFRAFKPSERAKVKTLWDATTFWPRRFHPFAVRPYAERAVPEIQGRLYELIENRQCRVVIAAHSQGAVLAYCALLHLARWREDVTKQVALVTFGSPLHRIHSRYFPAYFQHRTDFGRLASQLFTDGPTSISWVNLYHRTDYIGQEAFVGSPHARDWELPDPAIRPSQDRRSLRTSWAVPADPPQPIFTCTLVHSYYNNSVELRACVRNFETWLAR